MNRRPTDPGEAEREAGDAGPLSATDRLRVVGILAVGATCLVLLLGGAASSRGWLMALTLAVAVVLSLAGAWTKR